MVEHILNRTKEEMRMWFKSTGGTTTRAKPDALNQQCGSPSAGLTLMAAQISSIADAVGSVIPTLPRYPEGGAGRRNVDKSDKAKLML